MYVSDFGDGFLNRLRRIVLKICFSNFINIP